MAKNLKSRLFDPAGVPPDYGTQVAVGIKATEGTTIVKLDDGGELEFKTLVFEVKRSLNRHNSDGNPVYAVQAAQIIKSKVPPRLRLKLAPAKAPTLTNRRKKP